MRIPVLREFDLSSLGLEQQVYKLRAALAPQCDSLEQREYYVAKYLRAIINPRAPAL